MGDNMKRFLLFTICLFIAFSFNACYKQIEPIELPDDTEVTTINIVADTKSVVLTSKEDIEGIISAVSKAKPTNKPTLNDTPQVNEYFKIEFNTEKGLSAQNVYVYMDNTKSYAEQAYRGIYLIDNDVFSLINSYVNR